MVNRSFLFASLVGLMIFAACGGNIPSAKTLANYQETNPSTTRADDLYVIGAGDILSIDVWREPQLSKQQVPVRLDGKISLPLVNDVDAAGHTVSGLRTKLTEDYRAYVAAPEISITVVRSLSKRIYVLGNVANPGEYPLEKNMTVIQCIARAGGLGPWADSKHIRLIRRISGVDRSFLVDYSAIVSGADFGYNILLQPDDTIYVP